MSQVSAWLEQDCSIAVALREIKRVAVEESIRFSLIRDYILRIKSYRVRPPRGLTFEVVLIFPSPNYFLTNAIRECRLSAYSHSPSMNHRELFTALVCNRYFIAKLYLNLYVSVHVAGWCTKAREPELHIPFLPTI